ncbi:L-threonylcarbamoyladenylate synthase [Paludibacter jiangxiensis]|uniref:L-threonylcarbamoyladenylate synthase n=1 Tax=Paludibacter jiangxiensis TaxID=681398 RepID=A0A161L7P3_9BACT|nr:L-threonylcarbamoyladenylate synthase [Paludibacter jiangxiensis]GAT62804.1 L-threonylcarbamoyladenylate synthase [Paludibacter jiangxiensis]
MIQEIKHVIDVLRKGGVILYPTDTVWGLGCDATNEEAVKRIYEIKQRADNKAMLVLMDSTAKLQAYVSEIPDLAYDLIDMSAKPLTIIYPQGKNLAANLLGDDGSIGIRVSNEDFSKKLCEMFRRPIVSTSANISGVPTPRNFAQISQEIIDAVDYVVQYRQDDLSEPAPSSIIKLGPGSLVKVIRE